MPRSIPWQRLRIRCYTLLSWGLLLALFGSLVFGMADAVRGIQPGWLWPIVGLGLLLGWGLARTRLPAWQAGAIALAVCLTLTTVQVGQLAGPIARLLEALATFVGRLVQGTSAPTQALGPAWAALVADLDALWTRLVAWLGALSGGAPPYDPVVASLLWALALWAAVVWASWLVRRRGQPVLAVGPALTLLAFSLYYVGGRAGYLLPAVAASLVLKAWVGHEWRQRAWQRHGIRESARIRADATWLALGLSVGLMIAAALVPSISVRRLVDAVREMSAGREAGDQVGRGLGLEPRAQPGPVPILAARRGGDLPRRHLVGAGPELAEHAAMVVQVESAPLPPGEPYYWRSLTYDQYTGRGWSAGPTVLVDYEAGEPALLAQPSARQLVRQNVRLARDAARLVFVTGSLLTVDRDFEVAWRTPPEADVAGDAFGGAMQAQSYRADSLVPVFGADDLRAAGQSYPRWVLERYLNIPEEVPDRVLALARDLTATEPTPYDRALALERYLRQIPYTLDLPAPPLDRDLVDYFLFDLRRGYCDYYASAMVILARAAGLPARLVTGYATGTYDARNDHYVVTEAQAHSWVDIYFPGYGWVEFEPTAGLPALDRAAAAVPPVPPEQQSPSEPITAQRARLGWRLGLGIGLGLLGLVVVGGVAWLVLDGLRLRRLSSRAAALELYRRLVRISRWLGLRPRSSDTPYEFAASFAQGVQHLAQARRMQGLLRSVPADVHGLASLCTRALYSFHALPAREHQQALGAWGRLRWRLWAAGMIQRLPLVG